MLPAKSPGWPCRAPVRDSHMCSTMIKFMQVGDLVRLGTGGIQQFRVVELDDTGALVEPTLEAPGAYPFRMRLVDLHAWTD